MKEHALIWLLWAKNLDVLAHVLTMRKFSVLVTLENQATPELQQLLYAQGTRIVTIESYFARVDIPSCKINAEYRVAVIRDCIGGENWRGFIQSQGLDQPEHAGEIVLNGLEQKLLDVELVVGALDEINAEFFVDALVVNEDVTRIGNLIVEWARSRGIPSLHLAHALPLGVPTSVHRRLFADRLAVFGERAKESYLDAGISPEKIDITGNPAWDRYTEWKAARAFFRSEICGSLVLDPALPIVVFGTFWNADLTAALHDDFFRTSLTAFINLYPELRGQGVDVQLVIKDRYQASDETDTFVAQICQKLGIPAGRCILTRDNAEKLILAADLTISCHSNFAVESLLAETPAINLIRLGALRLGNMFDADCGVLEIEVGDLLGNVHKLLSEPALCAELRHAMRAAASYFNIGTDGRSSERVAALLLSMCRQPTAKHVWQQYLDVEEIDATGYHEGARGDLVAMFTNQPRFVLDIGCAAGGTGRVLKQQYPQAQVWGIETNRAAAEVAATRLDKVLVGKFEEFDLEAEGIAKGSLDGVIVADVLEHMYNPWKVMALLRPFLAPHAQVIASIPNVRNLALMSDLASGHWRYEALGLLDITHIRFFTYKEVERFFRETGYRVARTTYGIDSRLRELFDQHKDHCPATIDIGKMVLRDITSEELHELCSLQFYVVAVPAESDSQYASETDAASLPHRRHLHLLEQHRLSHAEALQFEQRMAAWPVHPLFHVAIIVTPATASRLGGTVQSLAGQGYYRVRISILSADAPPADFVDNERIEWRQVSGPVFEVINRLFAESTADWLMVLNAGDQVAAHSLLFVAEQVCQHPQWRLIYADEDLLTESGQPGQPYFRPDFSPDLLRAYPYPGALVWVAKPLFNRLLGFDLAAVGAEFYDLQLRTLGLFGPAAFGHVPDILLHRWSSGRYDDLPTTQMVAANVDALQRHLQQSGQVADIVPGLVPGSQHVRYTVEGRPLVSILIPTRDNVDLLRRCLETVLDQTDYPDFELLIIDTGSQDPAALDYLQGLESLQSDSVRVYSLPGPFNYARVMNLAAAQAQGDFLLLLNNDIAPLAPDWLREMIGHAQRPEVGVVGPRLLKPDGTVQQAGLVLGLFGAAETPWLGLAHDALSGHGQAQLVQNVSAVSGSCLLIRKALYLQVGGMNESMAIGYSDVDLCLKVGQLGLWVVYTPFASLLHEGGATLKNPDLAGDVGTTLEADRRELYLRWLPQLARDPFYNPNLSLNDYGCQIEPRTGLTWHPLSWKPLPRILAHPADNQGCGHYRVIQPLSRAVERGLIEATHSFSYYTPVEMERFEIDTWLLQRQLMPHQTELIRRYKELHKCLLVFELDDLTTNLPQKSLHREHLPKEIRKWLREAVALCDRFIVSTEPLSDTYRDLSADIRVVKNAIDTRQWGDLTPLRRQGRKPRIGWAGGISHTGDLEMIADVVAALADEVEWVFMGMCPDSLRPFVREFHPGVAIDRYPAALAGLNLDLALAPLEINHFNECKSNLRLLEYGVLGYPVIATDITPYQGDFPVTLVKNRSRDWVAAIREHLSDFDELARRGDAMRQHVLDHWALENHLDDWMAAWFRNR